MSQVKPVLKETNQTIGCLGAGMGWGRGKKSDFKIMVCIMIGSGLHECQNFS